MNDVSFASCMYMYAYKNKSVLKSSLSPLTGTSHITPVNNLLFFGFTHSPTIKMNPYCTEPLQYNCTFDFPLVFIPFHMLMVF